MNIDISLNHTLKCAIDIQSCISCVLLFSFAQEQAVTFILGFFQTTSGFPRLVVGPASLNISTSPVFVIISSLLAHQLFH